MREVAAGVVEPGMRLQASCVLIRIASAAVCANSSFGSGDEVMKAEQQSSEAPKMAADPLIQSRCSGPDVLAPFLPAESVYSGRLAFGLPHAMRGRLKTVPAV